MRLLNKKFGKTFKCKLHQKILLKKIQQTLKSQNWKNKTNIVTCHDFNMQHNVRFASNFFSRLIFANFRKHLHCYGNFLHATNFSSTTNGTCLDYCFKHPSLLEGENLCVVEAQIRLFSCWWATLKSIMDHSMECYRTNWWPPISYMKNEWKTLKSMDHNLKQSTLVFYNIIFSSPFDFSYCCVSKLAQNTTPSKHINKKTCKFNIVII